MTFFTVLGWITYLSVCFWIGYYGMMAYDISRGAFFQQLRSIDRQAQEFQVLVDWLVLGAPSMTTPSVEGGKGKT